MEKDTTKPETPTGERYHKNVETEEQPTLTTINEDDVTINSSEINDDSTGMGEDDFLGKTKNSDQ